MLGSADSAHLPIRSIANWRCTHTAARIWINIFTILARNSKNWPTDRRFYTVRNVALVTARLVPAHNIFDTKYSPNVRQSKPFNCLTIYYLRKAAVKSANSVRFGWKSVVPRNLAHESQTNFRVFMCIMVSAIALNHNMVAPNKENRFFVTFFVPRQYINFLSL